MKLNEDRTVRLDHIEGNKLMTALTEQSKAILKPYYLHSSLNLNYNFDCAIFTATKKLVNVEARGMASYRARMKGVTTIYDDVLDKTDLVILLDSPDLQARANEVISLGNTSVYRNDLLYMVVGYNIVAGADATQSFIIALTDSLNRFSNIELYFKGEWVSSSIGVYNADKYLNVQELPIRSQTPTRNLVSVK